MTVESVRKVSALEPVLVMDEGRWSPRSENEIVESFPLANWQIPGFDPSALAVVGHLFRHIHEEDEFWLVEVVFADNSDRPNPDNTAVWATFRVEFTDDCFNPCDLRELQDSLRRELLVPPQ